MGIPSALHGIFSAFAEGASAAAALYKALQHNCGRLFTTGTLPVHQFIFGQHLLGFFPSFIVQEMFVTAVGNNKIWIVEVPARFVLRIPADFTNIDWISQDIFNGPAFPAAAALCFDSHGVQLCGNGTAAHAADVAVKNHFYKWSGFRISIVFFILNQITKSRCCDRLPTDNFFAHATPDFLSQVDAVIFVHGLYHGFHKNGHFAVPNRLCDRYDFNSALLAQHGFINNAVLPVPREAGKFPDNNYVKRPWLPFSSANHPHKLRTLLCCFSTDAFILPKNKFLR